MFGGTTNSIILRDGVCWRLSVWWRQLVGTLLGLSGVRPSAVFGVTIVAGQLEMSLKSLNKLGKERNMFHKPDMLVILGLSGKNETFYGEDRQ